MCKRRFVATTNSNNGLHVYRNLAAGMVLTGSISYCWPTSPTSGCWKSSCTWWRSWTPIRAGGSAGALCRTLGATLTVEALKMTLARRPAPGLVHHADRGVQYAAGDYTDLLLSDGIVISIIRRGNLWPLLSDCRGALHHARADNIYPATPRPSPAAGKTSPPSIHSLQSQQPGPGPRPNYVTCAPLPLRS